MGERRACDTPRFVNHSRHAGRMPPPRDRGQLWSAHGFAPHGMATGDLWAWRSRCCPTSALDSITTQGAQALQSGRWVLQARRRVLQA